MLSLQKADKEESTFKIRQRYCGTRDCQLARKNRHERERLKNDPEYYLKRKAQKISWRNKQRGAYQKIYRENHPEYTLGNLFLQKTRYQRTKTRPVSGDIEKIVKTDTLIVALSIHSGVQEGLAGNPAFL